MSRQGMEESYETFEEELGPPRADPPPQKPVRQIRRPEMYATRKVREEMPPVPQPRAEPRILPREPSFPRQTSFPKTSMIQNPMQIETPWENVTLNRCLFVAITILVLTSGCQRLNETLRGQGPAEEEEEYGLTVRRSGLRHRVQPAEPETSLWEVMLWWLPDLDDDEDDEEEDDDGEVKRGKSKRGAAAAAAAQTSRGFRNKQLPVKNLMRKREGKLKDRRAKKGKDEEIRDKKEKEKTEEPKEAADDEEEEEGNEESVPRKSKKSEEQKEKRKAQTG